MRLSFLCFLFLFLSCESSIVRTDYKLEEVGPFIVSNSQTNPFRFTEKTSRGLKIKYELIVKNFTGETQTIDVSGSQISIDKRSKGLTCNVQGDLEVASQEKRKVICPILVSAKDFPMAQGSDVVADVWINLTSDDIFYTTYKIVSEDLQ